MRHEDLIGLAGPDFDFPVELGKNREFAAALHAFQDVFHAGRTPLMFPTLPIIASYLWGYMPEEPRGTDMERLDLADKMSLDGEQEFFFHGERPRAGDRLTGRSWMEDIWEKDGRRGGLLKFYKMRTEFRDADTGDLRITLDSTSVVPEGLPDETPATTKGTSGAFMKRDDPRDQFMGVPAADTVTIRRGDGPPAVTMPPHTLTDCLRYQITTGNYGAGHHDHLAAVDEGFPTWFGMGMYHAGLLANLVCAWLGAERLARFKVRFLDNSWPGDVLTYAATVDEVLDVEGGRRVARLAIVCRRGDSPVVRGQADFDVT
jgi:acyl dehydratase